MIGNQDAASHHHNMRHGGIREMTLKLELSKPTLSKLSVSKELLA